MSRDYTTRAVLLLGVCTLIVGITSSLGFSRVTLSTEKLEQRVATPANVVSTLELVGPHERVAISEPWAAGEVVVHEEITGVTSEQDVSEPLSVDPFPPREDRDEALVQSVVVAYEDSESNCPLVPSQGGVVVDFSTDDARPLRADGSRAEAERTASLALPEGSYIATILLTHEREDSGRLDRVYLKFYDGSGELIATTSPTRDLTEGEWEARERTAAFELPRAVSSVTVRHLAYAAREPHFLNVPCVLIESEQKAPTGVEGVPQPSAAVRELEVSVVHGAGEGTGRVPETPLGTGARFSVSEREEAPPEAVHAVRAQTAAVGNADIMRVLFPLTMLAFTLVGLLALSLARPRA